MKTIDEARRLAETMIELGARAGREVVCLLTDMDQPLGATVGNALEVREALATLRGDGPPDLTELVLVASTRLLALSDLAIDERESRRRVEGAVADGSAARTWRRWIEAQGGTADESALEQAPVVRVVEAPASGSVTRLGAIDVGNAALRLGAGRRTKDDAVDHAVGVVCLRKLGDRVERGEPLAEVHARDEASAGSAAADVLAAYEVGEDPPRRRSVLLEVVP
jgi:pyrimidine-nucleoside phosphorylase